MRFFASLLILTGLLSSCSTVTTSCPPPRYMDEKVADELNLIPFEGYEDLYDWLAEIEVLNEQLEECQ